MISVIFVGILCFILGKALALGSLISQPAEILSKAPDPEKVEPGTVWYVKGDRAGRTAWEAKEDAWKSGAVDRLSLSEEELNQWSQERLKAEKPAPGSEAESSWKDKFHLTLGETNFKLLDGKLQIATEVFMDELVKGRSFMYVVVGEFESNGKDGVVFVPEKGTLGTAPVGSLPGYRDLVNSSIWKQFEALPDTAWLREDLQNLESVDISSGEMVIRRKSGT